jgi:hypothetical protein
MSADPFAERLAKVRHRFVSALESKIEDTYAAIPNLSGSTPAGVEAIVAAYRRIHDIVGIGPTVGFPATGRAARDVEDVLRGPYQSGRGLTEDEILDFKKRLDALREAATRELQFFYAV